MPDIFLSYARGDDEPFVRRLACSRCGKPVKLNPFVIEADWRPVAAAWRGEALDHGGAK
jgi:hypothetical protein